MSTYHSCFWLILIGAKRCQQWQRITKDQHEEEKMFAVFFFAMLLLIASPATFPILQSWLFADACSFPFELQQISTTYPQFPPGDSTGPFRARSPRLPPGCSWNGLKSDPTSEDMCIPQISYCELVPICPPTKMDSTSPTLKRIGIAAILSILLETTLKNDFYSITL